MYDFIYNLLFIYNELCMMGMGENPRNIQNTKNKEKFPIGWPPIPTSTKWRPIVSGVRKHRKQAGPNLGGGGILD